MQDARSQTLSQTPTQVLSQLSTAMSGGASNPTTLIVYNAKGTSGHSITPYAIQDQGSGTFWVRVYDNNYPDDANRFVVINTSTNTWSYNLGGSIGTWGGDANSHSLGAIPISIYAQPAVCPWCGSNTKGPRQVRATTTDQVWLAGQGHLLITNSEGQRIGYVGSQFVNEIQNAFGSVPVGGLGVEQEPIYSLPSTDTYNILLDGQTLTQQQTAGVALFGPGYALSADGISVNPTSSDSVKFAPDGTQVGYRSTNTQAITLTLALDGATSSNQFQVRGTTIGAGQVVTLTANMTNGQLALNNQQNSGGTYDLVISQVTSTGTQDFVHTGIAIGATDTQYADFGAWNGSGSMNLYIDHGSKGTIDQTITLTNQAHMLFLPLILR